MPNLMSFLDKGGLNSFFNAVLAAAEVEYGVVFLN